MNIIKKGILWGDQRGANSPTLGNKIKGIWEKIIKLFFKLLSAILPVIEIVFFTTDGGLFIVNNTYSS